MRRRGAEERDDDDDGEDAPRRRRADALRSVRARASMKRRPTTSMAAANIAPSTTVRTKAVDVDARAAHGAEQSERASQPTRSSIIAAAMTSRPTSDLKRPRSSSVLAMTGSAEMLSATAEEQRHRGAPGGVDEVRVGQEEAEREAARRWQDDPEQPRGQRAPAPPAKDAQVDLEAHDDEQEHDRDRRVAADHRLARRRARRATPAPRGAMRPNTVGPRRIPRRDLADDERQPRRSSKLAEQARSPEQGREREQEGDDVVIGQRAASPVIPILPRVGPDRRRALHRAQRILRRRGVRARQGPGDQPALAGAQRRAEGAARRVDRRAGWTATCR